MNKIKKGIQVDGVFFFFNILKSIKNIIFSKIISFFVKKSLKIEFPCKIKGAKYIEFSEGLTSGTGLWVEAIDNYFDQRFSPQIKLGKGINLSNNVHIAAINSVIIGQNVLIGSNVLITDHQHGGSSADIMNIIPRLRPLLSRGGVYIGDCVWLGDGVIILDNVKIGDNCIIGANSLVLNSIPENSVAVGSPARVIKTLKKRE